MVVNPIQNVRFLDPEFAGSGQNGSIVTPYADAADFLTEIENSGEGWQLLLPANTSGAPAEIAITGSLANGSTPAHVVFSGVGKDVTHATFTQITRQFSANGGFTFRDFTAHADMDFEGDTLAVSFENVKVPFTVHGDSSGSSAMLGTLRLVNCEIDYVDMGGVTITADECSLGGFSDSSAQTGIVIGYGTLRNCVFQNNSKLKVLNSDTVTLIGCKFGSNCKIDVPATFPAPKITVDNFTFDSIRRADVTYTNGGQQPTYKLFEWCTVAADIIHEGTIILPSGSVTSVNFGNPNDFDPDNNPRPQISRGCITTFKQLFGTSPFPAGVAIVASTINSDGEVVVEISNTGDDTGTSGVPICVVYLPEVSPNS